MKVTVSRHRDGPEIFLDGFTGQPMAEPMVQQRYDIADRALRAAFVQ